MQVTTSIPLPQLKELQRSLDSKVFPRLMSSAINDAQRYGRTQIGRGIRQEVAIKAADIRKVIKATNSTPLTLRSVISLKREAMSLKRYGPRQTKSGVSVRVRKKQPREQIKSAFISDEMGGHVFKRLGKARFPIKRQQGPTAIGILTGVPNLLKEQETLMQDKMMERLQSKIVAHMEGKAFVR